MYIDGQDVFDGGCDSYLEIATSDDAIYTNSNVQRQVQDAILGFFDQQKLRIGMVVNLNRLLQDIYEIPSVNRVRTIFIDPLDGSVTSINGISMATWSPILQPLDALQPGYDDLEVGNGNRALEDFQFPMFTGGETLARRIRVITKSTSSINVTRE